MKNDSIASLISIAVMALAVVWLGGGLDGLLGQAEGFYLAATSLDEGSGTAWIPIGTLWPFIVGGGVLAAAVAVFRSSAGDDKLSIRKHLAIQYQLQAKDLDT